MAKSTREFDRWRAQEQTTWSYRVYRKYDLELTTLLNAHIIANRFAYASLRRPDADWSDLPSKYFEMSAAELDQFPSLRNWSDSYNLFDNWINLSTALTIASNLETFLASVISMALDSDPGVLFGASKSIDGAIVLKHGRHGALKISDQVEVCIKGEWSSRLDAFENLFGACPKEFRSAHAKLERLRQIRNRFGHAFGRDIEDARLHGTLTTLPMEKLSREKIENLKKQVMSVVQSVDKFLLENHVGDFEAVQFYCSLYPTLHQHVPQGQRAAYLKKEIGWFGAGLRGKKYCNGLVKYWEAL